MQHTFPQFHDTLEGKFSISKTHKKNLAFIIFLSYLYLVNLDSNMGLGFERVFGLWGNVWAWMSV